MAPNPELEEEQGFLDHALEALEFMRVEARQMLDSVIDLGRGGTFQSRTERDIVVRTSLARLAQLDIGDQALCFGRIDRVPEEGQQVGESFHIGRIAVSDADREPLVVDWRAPVAEPFYRATGLDPHGLVRRRHLGVQGKKVLSLEDEYFDQPDAGASLAERANRDGHAGGEPDGTVNHADGTLSAGDIELGGPGALLAAVGKARTGRMGDIVSTIQREQDEIIRSPSSGLLVVQGGPGTGKTAVALHRAAYLLYTHRFPLERQGVLVVGPNPLFLRYIEQVLPSLGETGVTLSTVSTLVPEVRVRGLDRPEVALLKGDARMARVISKAIQTRQRRLPADVSAPFGSTVLRLSVEDSARIVGLARRRPGTHNHRRRFVEQQLGLLLAERYQRSREDSGSQLSFGMDEDDEAYEIEQTTRPDPTAVADVGRQIRRLPPIAEALDRMWPRLAPHELLHDLFGARPLLSAAGKGILDSAEQALLYRPRSSAFEDVPWTAGDAALADEARALLGTRRVKGEKGDARGEEGTRSFGHIVIDEAQDLSPMQLRVLARRSISGSMTVVGDIAQATGPWAPASWMEVARHLAPGRPVRLTELTVSYRTPIEVAAVAGQVLAVAAPGIAPPRLVRRSGWEPQIEKVPSAYLLERAAEMTALVLESLQPGRVAALAPSALLQGMRAALEERGLECVDPRDARGEGLAASLVLLPANETNGLEFDGVVVVEPALIASEVSNGEQPPVTSTRGLRALYVALTRPTQRLAVVHSMPLPVDLVPG